MRAESFIPAPPSRTRLRQQASNPSDTFIQI